MRATIVSAALLAGVALLAQPSTSAACTTFLVESDTGPFIGKSYDWHTGEGLVFLNKKGMSKQALPFPFDKSFAKWRSKYASLTFNQYGQEFPNGGMNEAGLVVEIMWLNETSYPPKDNRPAINELQWIQYQLDSYGSVEEMVAHAHDLRVSPVQAKVHYLACDKSSACASFEYIGGKLVVTSGKDMPAKVLTNNSYSDSQRLLVTHAGFGGTKAAPKGAGSLSRFVRAARATKALKKVDLAYSFGVLDSVRNGSYTKWNIVYEPKSLQVHFRTRKNKTIKTLSLTQQDLSCGTGARVSTLHIDPGKDGLRFRPLGHQDNAALIKKSFKEVQGLPPFAQTIIANFPSTMRCAI